VLAGVSGQGIVALTMTQRSILRKLRVVQRSILLWAGEFVSSSDRGFWFEGEICHVRVSFRFVFSGSAG
jgi:hypothetical protein